MQICESPFDFWYCFTTFYIATIFLAGEFVRMEAKYEGWKNPEETELIFFYWIPIINTCLLLMFYASFRYDLYILKHRMVREVEKIIREDDGEDIINKFL